MYILNATSHVRNQRTCQEVCKTYRNAPITETPITYQAENKKKRGEKKYIQQRRHKGFNPVCRIRLKKNSFHIQNRCLARPRVILLGFPPLVSQRDATIRMYAHARTRGIITDASNCKTDREFYSRGGEGRVKDTVSQRWLQWLDGRAHTGRT